jgi:hypothetical protein
VSENVEVSTILGCRSNELLSAVFFYIPIFYLQAVQMQVHLANGVMGGEAGRGAPISIPL